MDIFCDHLTYEIPYFGQEISGGRMLELDMNGEKKWEFTKMLPFEGSHTTRVMVKTVDKGMDRHNGYGRVLYVRGNPIKYFQGHNLWGTTDIKSLIFDMTTEIMQIIGYNCMTTHKILRSDMREVDIKRIDVTAMYELPTLSDVRQWLRAATYSASGKHQKTSSSKTTLYIGEHSARFTLCAYCKADELTDHKLPETLSEQKREFLTNWAQNKLRIECRYRRKLLIDLEMTTADKFTNEVIQAMFYTSLKKKLILAGDFSMIPEEIEKLPKKYQRIYHQWNGGGVIQELMSMATAYRYRNYFVEQFGIDILKPCPNLATQSNVIPLIRVLEAKPASIPSQAYSMGLVYRPNSERG